MHVKKTTTHTNIQSFLVNVDFIIDNSICVRWGEVYWSCPQIPLVISGLRTPSSHTVPTKIWKPWLGCWGEIRITTVLLSFTWPCCSYKIRRKPQSTQPPPCAAFRACEVLTPAHIFPEWGTAHLGQLYSSFLFFLLFFSQPVWVTATWNREENGINMLEMLESDL